MVVGGRKVSETNSAPEEQNNKPAAHSKPSQKLSVYQVNTS